MPQGVAAGVRADEIDRMEARADSALGVDEAIDLLIPWTDHRVLRSINQLLKQ